MKKKQVLSWALYDWANSAFATTVMAGFFPVFFKQYWNAGVDPTVSTARLGVANSVASIVIVLLAPILGAIADRSTARKKFLLIFASLGIFMTVALSLVARGNWLLSSVLFMVAVIGFSGGNVFYDSLLTSVSEEKDFDRISALGYSLGYLGGGILFAFNVWMTVNPEIFGFPDSTAAVRFAFITVGIWWAVFSVPLLLYVKEPPSEGGSPRNGVVRAALRQLMNTFKSIRRLKTICLFLAAYWLYIDGVDTIFRMAVDYGISIGLNHRDLIKALLITQFVGFPSAIAFGYLGGKLGTKRCILMAIAMYIVVSIWGAFMHSQKEFYLMAITIGLVQGGIQALSRSFFARIIPASKSAEYFGF
ncbi:MAG: MFS transporter, partial [bacterium]|nr:MFS transporter [bacterium]